jgi:hypothetical protein
VVVPVKEPLTDTTWTRHVFAPGVIAPAIAKL